MGRADDPKVRMFRSSTRLVTVFMCTVQNDRNSYLDIKFREMLSECEVHGFSQWQSTVDVRLG